MKTTFIFELPEELKEKLAKLAKEKEVSMGKYLRDLIKLINK